MDGTNSYFEDLEKIANEIVVDENQEPMTEDPMPAVPPEDVEATQAANSAAEEQLPASPEDTEELAATLDVAKQELNAAEEQLAEASEQYLEFEKTAAPLINESLPAMGAFAKLIEFSTNKDSDPVLHKLAQERLQTALSSEDAFIETLHKTAQELFEDEANLNALYTKEGMEFVVETLDSFADDEELSKHAFEAGQVFNKAVETIKDVGRATRDFWKLRSEVDIAKEELDKAKDAYMQADVAFNTARGQGASDDVLAPLESTLRDASQTKSEADDVVDEKVSRRNLGAIGVGGGGAALAGGGLFGGKKIYDAVHSPEEEELSVKTAGVRMNPENSVNYYEGGKSKMAQTIVPEFLKIAGAAALLNIANNESFETGIRKEATQQFNQIAYMNRKDMEESFVKVATELYTEDQLHEIVAGNHTEELLDKVAFFLAANDASADELQKVAGADGVAAKGVAGALTDAKKAVEEHIEKDKVKTEKGNLNPGSTKAQDTTGYSVVRNPGKYDVDKTAYLLQQAHMQKEAAINAYAEAENFISTYGTQ